MTPDSDSSGAPRGVRGWLRSKALNLRSAVLSVGRLLLARPGLQPLNKLLFDVSLRGMGILNYRNRSHSGEEHVLKILAAMAEGSPHACERPVVLDVGANVGSYSELVHALLPSAEIHAFEPHPYSVELMEQRLGEWLTIVPAAVGASAGKIDLFDYEDANGSSHASVYRGVFTDVHKSSSVKRSVPVVRIDDYIEEKGLSHVLLLKVDTEGHELQVLKGGSRSLNSGVIECVQFEFNEMNIISRVFLRDFADALSGFVLFRTLPHGMTPVRGVPLEEIFAFQNIVAIKRDSQMLASLLS